MVHELIDNLGRILACPYCLDHLEIKPEGLYCSKCKAVYPLLRDTQIDLRLQRPKMACVEYEVGKSLDDILSFDYRPLARNRFPEVDFREQPVPKKFTEALRSYIPKAPQPGALALDIGCGLMPPREMVELAGYRYVGLDYKNDSAHILGDGHALPFQADSFDLIISMNVLEHLQHPHIAYNNIYRILKTGCLFFGSVSFLEPFHDNSFYHHTHIGLYNTLSTAGFKVITISPNVHWPVLRALWEMNALPRTAKPFLKLANGINSLRQRIRPQPERILRSSGSFSFIATKIV